jgi:RNA polymerase sigma factor (sigma-70 family)
MSDFERHNDEDLVAAYRAGDRAALTAIYDRYADRIYSYCLTMLRSPDDAADATHDAFIEAATRLDQLNDPGELRPWLFAIARNEARAEGRHRAKVKPEGDLSETLVDDPDIAMGAKQAELRSLVWEAVDGLGERDQELMALHLTEGLEGEDLAAAMGVDMSHLPVLVSRTRNRVEKAMGALLIARLGNEDCDQLDSVLGDWEGRYDADVRARVTRHIGGCQACQERRASLMAPAGALPGIMVATAPAPLRERVMRDVVAAAEPDVPAAPTTPVQRSSGLSDMAMLAIFAAVTLLLGLIGFAVSARFEPIDLPEGTLPPVAEGSTTTTSPFTTSTTIAIGTTAPGSDTTQAATPGAIEVSTGAIDFGDDATTGEFEVTNIGGQAISFTAETSVEAIVLSAGGEELGPGETVTYDVVLDREEITEGDIDETISLTWEGGTAAVAVTGTQMGSPILHNPQASPAQVEVSGNPDCLDTSTTVSVRIRDRSPLETVVVRWSPDGGSNQETSMTEIGGDVFEAEIGPFTAVRSAEVRMVAIDELGNAGGATIQVPVVACP